MVVTPTFTRPPAFTCTGFWTFVKNRKTVFLFSVFMYSQGRQYTSSINFSLCKYKNEWMNDFFKSVFKRHIGPQVYLNLH